MVLHFTQSITTVCFQGVGKENRGYSSSNWSWTRIYRRWTSALITNVGMSFCRPGWVWSDCLQGAAKDATCKSGSSLRWSQRSQTTWVLGLWISCYRMGVGVLCSRLKENDNTVLYQYICIHFFHHILLGSLWYHLCYSFKISPPCILFHFCISLSYSGKVCIWYMV